MTENKSKFDIVSKMTIIGIVAVLILILAVVIVSCSGSGSTPEPTEGIIITDPSAEAEEEVIVKAEIERALAVVKYVDTANNQLMIYDIEKLKTITLAMDSSIEIKDEYGTDIALTQIELGDMVETKYEVDTLKPEFVKITAVTWERKDVSNMVVDTELNTIKIANETYHYTDELITSDGGVPFDILELSTADEALVRGYKDHVWSIVLLSGHGNLILENHDIFIGGEIEISSRISLLIEKDMNIPVTAGVHNVVVSKQGVAPYVTQVMVEEGKEVVIDLSEAQPKIGIIEFILLQDDVMVYLNDELLDLTQEIKLDFGNYTIRAEKEGFSPWESELDLNQAYMQYKIDLEVEPRVLYIDKPVGAEVYIEGQYIGIIPTQTPFIAGTKTVTVRKDGFYTYQQDFQWVDTGKDVHILLPDLIPIETTPEEEPVIEGEGTPTDDIYTQSE